ncbi:hypothetical protein FHW12_000894 [Dokdonella fugitiva]|uniref:DUF4288 domain-containing protein n=1 Tax=Dokdonella fugitiva TaxID=328517 RepID=A0A839EVS7_9GAMM|nr:DUF4288 domain-containing protein [Dokdonella fugitiva]MBA8886703.1 hypothetical protein [Dokdonella fugitiva]
MPKTSSAKTVRFSAKLLFQFRIVDDGKPGVMRMCEERIVVLRAETARKALTMAKQRGKRAEHRYRNDHGGMVHFEFVGILDLLHLGIECDEDEVWYDITQRKLPMERAAAILPPERVLSAIRNGP